MSLLFASKPQTANQRRHLIVTILAPLSSLLFLSTYLVVGARLHGGLLHCRWWVRLWCNLLQRVAIYGGNVVVSMARFCFQRFSPPAPTLEIFGVLPARHLPQNLLQPMEERFSLDSGCTSCVVEASQNLWIFWILADLLPSLETARLAFWRGLRVLAANDT